MGEEKGAAVGLEEGMQCSQHPYKSNPNPGGICAFCLQEKLGKLVSSTNSTSPFFPLHPPPSSNHSSPPSFRSIDNIQPNTNTTSSSSSYTSTVKGHRSRSSRISSFLTSASSHPHHYRRKQQPPAKSTSSSSSSSAAVAAAPALNLKRTKSVAPRPVGDGPVNPASITMDSPRKKSFWSFLYLSSSSSTGTSASPHTTTTVGTCAANAAAMRRRSVSSFSLSRGPGHLGSTDEEGAAKRDANLGAAAGENESPSPGGSHSQASSSSFGRKVARSRSVGCGSRSFSGDFLERISNGFGDCTLRRVESHRESNHSKVNKMVLPGQLEDNDDGDCDEAQRMRIRCSGFFGSSSSSSSYWISTAAEGGARMSTGGVGRSNRGWGWAFASPMRAFRPPPASSASSVKSMPASSHLKGTNGIRDLPQPQPSPLATTALPPPVSLS